ncbi:putative transcription factor interactor and regulator LIM family [Helianthus annuus]|uniref:Putative zinc finger, LIM-type n=1 Tax=Helianthus annuus TaxID=4232 RepID=A0A251VEG9_HELAN|nr:LIM domain-containing protein PLIM2c [Helianthus annuus]KAF5816808.1 putative transcription factor interactor and regulator LIM family [Helianthus annuus]KAJ0610072.1 putative transcription factor interactor and regulator LIM family [Helianthus annuus]
MAFGGTIDKCNACDKTVHFVDLMTVDNVIYHKKCFKCTHCKGTLVMSNYSSMDGVLYCMPHFEQLFKETGNYSKNFRTSKLNRDNSTAQLPNKFSNFFSGTLDKCRICEKTVYFIDKMTMEGESYHKQCFRCVHGGCPLTHSSYAALNGNLYCRHHFAQLFLEKGTLSHVLKAAADRKKNTIPDHQAEAEKVPLPEQESEVEKALEPQQENQVEKVVETEVESKLDTTEEVDDEQESETV